MAGAGGGRGGSLGEPGQNDTTSNANGSIYTYGGAGGKAITGGIEIAVSGTIIGAVG